MSVQIIVICASDVRKQFILKQFDDLSIPYPVYFLDASIPSKSEEYFIGTKYDDYMKKNICCTRSHCRAIAYAGLESSPPFSIIVEDDVALHKTKFVSIVEELRLGWDQLIPPMFEYVSLGWILQHPHKHYSNNCTPFNLMSSPETGWFFAAVVGLQAYMMKREIAATLSCVINKDTFVEMNECILANEYPNMKDSTGCEAADHFLPRMRNPLVLFPPIAIECESLTSLLEHNNFTKFWNKYFAGREDEKLLYYA